MCSKFLDVVLKILGFRNTAKRANFHTSGSQNHQYECVRNCAHLALKIINFHVLKIRAHGAHNYRIPNIVAHMSKILSKLSILMCSKFVGVVINIQDCSK